MWPFTKRISPETLTAAAIERLREHETRLTDVELDAKNLLRRLQKLEGAFHGVKAAHTDPETDERLTKAQLRLKLGLVPGRVPPNLR